MSGHDLTIGDVARRTGLTERTLRYYEELGLVTPARDDAGRRRYDSVVIDRLYRVRLLRELGQPLAAIDPDADDLATLTRRHLGDLDARLAELSRQRERVRAVEERVLEGGRVADSALLDLLAGLAGPAGEEQPPTRRITLLVYRDLAAAHAWLVEVLGFAPGELTRDDSGRAVHGEVHVGDGVVWLHREAPEHRLLSPLATGGGLTASLAVAVDDVDAHHRRAVAAGAEVDHEPVDQPYGVREYSLRDLEGHLWSFQADLDHHEQHDEGERR
ncbi:MerR family transcriptional regulator [Nocardioides sp. C4-1]|uniref:MerR family transcriptional regulator n=1 Tax=Nocardioides sp. C4-1 TaxID=3151851 RepID=UPI003262FD04